MYNPYMIRLSKGLEKITGEPVDYRDRPEVFAKDFNVNFPLPEV